MTEYKPTSLSELLTRVIPGIARARLLPTTLHTRPIEFLLSKEQVIKEVKSILEENTDLLQNEMTSLFVNMIIDDNESNIMKLIKENMHLINEGIEKTDDSNFIGKKITLLHTAIITDKIEVAKFLIENVNDVNVKDLANDTALTISAMLGHADLIEQLHSKGANLEYQNVDGDSALCTSIFHERGETIKKLVKIGASLTNKCSKGKTPLDIAKMVNLSDYYEILQPKKDNIEENTINELPEEAVIIMTAEDFIELTGEGDLHY